MMAASASETLPTDKARAMLTKLSSKRTENGIFKFNSFQIYKFMT
jgi:hypothetical protein